MGADIGEPRLDLGDAMRVVRGLGFGQQLRALGVRLEHDFDQVFRAVRRFLRQPRRCASAAAVRRCRVRRRSRPVMTLKSVDLPVPLRPTRPTRAPGVIRAEASSKQDAAGNADSEVVDDKHARLLAERGAGRNPLIGERLADIAQLARVISAPGYKPHAIVSPANAIRMIRWRSSVHFRSSNPMRPRAI